MERVDSGLAHRNQASLVTLAAADHQQTGVAIDIGPVQCNGLTDAQAARIQRLDQRPIAPTCSVVLVRAPAHR